MITADVRHAVWEAARQAAAAGEIPPPGPASGQRGAGTRPDDASTLRPVPAALGGGPGRYASTLPYLLAAPGQAPDQVAAILAASLVRLDWIAEATPATGRLTITVTGHALAALAVRIPRALDCARSDILRGLRVPAAATAADLAGAPRLGAGARRGHRRGDRPAGGDGRGGAGSAAAAAGSPAGTRTPQPGSGRAR